LGQKFDRYEYNNVKWKIYRHQESHFSQEENLFEMQDNWSGQFISAKLFSK
jgi:hypothetical protein